MTRLVRRLSVVHLVLASTIPGAFAYAQDAPPADSAAITAKKLAEAGAAGTVAGNGPEVAGRFGIAFVGGFVTGIASSAGSGALGIGLVMVIGAATAAGSDPMRSIHFYADSTVLGAMERDPAYREAFLAAYSKRLGQRRARASAFGGAMGLGIGLYAALKWIPCCS